MKDWSKNPVANLFPRTEINSLTSHHPIRKNRDKTGNSCNCMQSSNIQSQESKSFPRIALEYLRRSWRAPQSTSVFELGWVAMKWTDWSVGRAFICNWQRMQSALRGEKQVGEFFLIARIMPSAHQGKWFSAAHTLIKQSESYATRMLFFCSHNSWSIVGSTLITRW